jgi:signal peptidase I
MKKSHKIVVVLGFCLAAAVVIMQLTNMLRMYDNASAANEPGLKPGTKLFVSNLVDYNNGDFICFDYEDVMFGKHVRTNRLVAKPGDVVTIKNGILYVNGKYGDRNRDVKHSYYLNYDDAVLLLKEKLIQSYDTNAMEGDKFMVHLSDSVAKRKGWKDKIILDPKGHVDAISKTYPGKGWNRDNFGPLRLPPGKYFVMGDNRHNTEDSRYIGLIDESAILGAVIF